MAKPSELEPVYRVLSSHSHPDFRLGSLAQSYTGADGQSWIDPMSPNLVKLLNLPRTDRYVYAKRKPLTTVSFEVYGNTSLWFLILSCTDYIHPHQIPIGEVILLPSVTAVGALLKETTDKKGLQGKLVII